jgi:hypothetical protein
MNLEMTPGFEEAIVPLLSSCGGTSGPMQNIARRIQRSKSTDLGEILGGLVDAPGPMREIIATCESTNGVLDLEGLIRHFASIDHTDKMTGLELTVARELTQDVIPIAHTLLPLTVLDGRYYYDCGDAYIEIDGLVQIGPTVGSPYAHLAGLICLRDGGLHTQILSEQAEGPVSTRAQVITRISYHDAPRLQRSTLEGAKELYSKS